MNVNGKLDNLENSNSSFKISKLIKKNTLDNNIFVKGNYTNKMKKIKN